jgi:hypothetical protein
MKRNEKCNGSQREEKNVVPVSGMPNFVHRKNDDSTFDSFCPSCFVTVANARLEAELEGKERDHICDPWDLKRFQTAAKLGFVAIWQAAHPTCT